MVRTFLLSSLFSFLCLSLKAQIFEQITGIDGTEFFDIKQNNAGVYLGTVESRTPGHYIEFAKSQDGMTWEYVDVPEGVLRFSFAIGNDKNLYCMTPETIFKSENGGTSWENINNGNFPGGGYGGKMQISETGTIFLLKSTDSKYRSTDGGNTWEEINLPGEYTLRNSLLLDTDDPDILFFMRTDFHQGLLRTTDGGLNWSYVYVPQDGMNFFYAALSPNDDIYLTAGDSLMKSTDYFETFETLNTPAISPYGKYRVVEFTNEGRMILCESHNAYYSDDDGETYTSFGVNDDISYNEFFITQDNSVFTATADLLYKSDNDLTNWEFAANNLPYGTATDLIFYENEVYATTEAGLWHSTDGGTEWDLIFDDFDSHRDNTSNRSVNQQNDLFINFGGELYRRNNGSAELTDITPDLSSFPFVGSRSSLFITNDNTVLLFILNRFFRSTDNGNTWEQVTYPDTDNYAFMGEIYQTDAGRIYFESDGYLIFSDNDGADWSLMNTVEFDEAVINQAGNIVLTLRDDTEYCLVSQDAGQTWQEVNLPTEININFRASTTIDAAGNFYLFHDGILVFSTDGGMTWKQFNTGDLVPFNSDMTFAPDGHLWMHDTGTYRSANPISHAFFVKGNLTVADENCLNNNTDADTISNGLISFVSEQDSFYIYSSPSGNYFTAVDTADYIVNTIPPNHLWQSCEDTIFANEFAAADTVYRNLTSTPQFDCPLLRVDINTARLRRCFLSDIYVKVQNEGTTAVENAVLSVNLDEFLLLEETDFPISEQVDNQLTFQLGNMGIGEIIRIKLSVTVSCEQELGYIHCVEAHVGPDENCGDFLDWSGAVLQTEGFCENDATVFTISNTGTGGMVSEQTYDIYENDTITESGFFFLASGESTNINYNSMSGNAQIVISTPPGYPYPGNPNTIIDNCNSSSGTVPTVLTWAQGNHTTPFSDGFCLPNIGSYDPNDKQATPAGYGEDRLISAGTRLEYKIRFQNTGSDTAFTVVVKDTLSPHFDIKSLHPGTSSHLYTLNILSGRVLEFTFNNIMLPDSSTNQAGSNGYLEFTIDHDDSLPVGTILENSAGIYFDFNDPIITNTVSRQIGDFTEEESPAENGNAQNTVNIYPQPLSESAVIEIKGKPVLKPGLLQVTDMTGRIMRTESFSGNRIIFHRESLIPGMYVLLLTEEGNSVGVAKFIVTDGF